RRRGRLYLMLVTVPAGAAVVTGLLLGFAIFSDGLGTRIRTRSFTWLDQRGGRAATWSRQMMYAGLPVSEGLHFGEHALVYPLNIEGSFDRRRRRRSRAIDWTVDQHLHAGYIRAREPTQLLVVAASALPARLHVRPASGDDDAIQWNATNELGGRLQLLIV